MKKSVIIVETGILVLILMVLGLLFLKPRDVEIKVIRDAQIKGNLIVGLGDALPSVNDFVDDWGSLDENARFVLDENLKINEKNDVLSVGEFKVTIVDDKNKRIYDSLLEVKDEEAPKLSLKNLSIEEGKSYKVDDFVLECTDNSTKECSLSFAEESMGKIASVGEHNITIIAKDASDNAVKVSTKLIVTKKEEVKVIVLEPVQKSSNKSVSKSTDTNVASKSEEVVKKGYTGKAIDLKSEALELRKKEANNVNKVLENVNSYRGEVSMSGLVLDEDLTTLAFIRALEMSYTGKFSHTRPNGKPFYSIFTEMGVNGANACGENIAYGYTNADSVSLGWKSSSGHYANMINNKFTRVGIGVSCQSGVCYWVQLFGN